jgi:hypothetical protein
MTDKVAVEFLDGSPRVEFKTRTYMCQADRVAFERRFNLTIAELHNRAAADSGRISDEHVAFFAWRAMNREVGDQGDFDAWIERVEEIDLEDLEAAAAGPGDEPGDAARPTVPTSA